MTLPALTCGWLSYQMITGKTDSSIIVWDMHGNPKRIPINAKVFVAITMPIIVGLTIWLEVIFLNLPRI